MIIKKNRFTVCIVSCLLLILFLSPSSHSIIIIEDGKTEWSQYRGPNRDGVAISNVSIKAWPKGSQPFEVWRKPIGEGFSGIVIVGEQLITAFAEDENEFLGGFEKTTGREVWRTVLGKMFVEEMGNGPRSTPTIDGDFAYMLEARPGAYLFVGQGDTPMCHHPAYDFNDEIAAVGASLFARIVERAQPVGQ